MALVRRIARLAAATGLAIKGRITADHPGVAKAWVCFQVVGAHVLVRTTFNVSKVVRLGSGRYRVVFATPMPDADYCWHAFARSPGTQALIKAAAALAADAKTDRHVEVVCTSPLGVLTDTAELNLTVWR